jgi:hypothetical protein
LRQVWAHASPHQQPLLLLQKQGWLPWSPGLHCQLWHLQQQAPGAACCAAHCRLPLLLRGLMVQEESRRVAAPLLLLLLLEVE